MKNHLLSSLVLFGSSALLPAATTFFEDFSSNAAGPNMTLGSGVGSPSTSFAGANFTTGGDSTRIYLGTNVSDYSTVDFVFEALVTVPLGGTSASSGYTIPFLGMGDANATGGFGEPGTTARLAMGVRPETGNLRVDIFNSATLVPGSNGSIPTVAGTTNLMRMTWNATSKTAVFTYDAGNNGSFEYTSSSVAGTGFTNLNSKLYVGGGNGISFDNISVTVIPEPSAALLGGLGLLGLLRRRR